MFIHQLVFSIIILKSNFSEVVAELGKKFDIVTSLEVIEHVNDKQYFVEQLAKLTKVCFLFSLKNTFLG